MQSGFQHPVRRTGEGETRALQLRILAGRDLSADETLAKHAAWVSTFADRYHFTAENVTEILQAEVGRVFEAVLEDAGVYKCDAAGRAAFMRFIEQV